MKKIISILLMVCLLLSFFSACGPQDTIDETKTQLYVGIFEGGVGTAWLDDLVLGFEEKYKDVSFEQGKTGVEIKISESKTDYSNTQLLANMPYRKEEVFIVNDCNYRSFV